MIWVIVNLFVQLVTLPYWGEKTPVIRVGEPTIVCVDGQPVEGVTAEECK